MNTGINLNHLNFVKNITKLHADIIRPAAALGCDPNDVLRGVFDVAGFAVHAVLRVDLQAIFAGIITHIFIHACGAVAAFRPGVGDEIGIDGHARVFER